MNGISITFIFLNAAMMLMLPRRWASLPLILGACYMTLDQGIDIGPFTFTIIRILVFIGLARILIRREKFITDFIHLDWLIIIWACWALISSAFHTDSYEALIFRLGLIYNICGIYFLIRFFSQSLKDTNILFCIVAILLVPISAEMLYESLKSYNLFSVLGGVSETPTIRDGRIRAQGPFAHSILAGNVGAVCLPLMVGIWAKHKMLSTTGIISCLLIIIVSASSGPILSAIAGVGALLMWNFRHQMRLVRWLAIFGYLTLEIFMKVPAYFMMARISPIGASTGWHRARLIESAFQHLPEWWFAGTDYTRHWMPTGVSWSQDHTDITNYYLKMGVIGGLPLMILLIFIFVKGFSYIGQIISSLPSHNTKDQFLIWAIGSSLFAHAATCISVSYFDQSFIFLYMTIAIIGSIWSSIDISSSDKHKKFIDYLVRLKIISETQKSLIVQPINTNLNC